MFFAFVKQTSRFGKHLASSEFPLPFFIPQLLVYVLGYNGRCLSHRLRLGKGWTVAVVSVHLWVVERNILKVLFGKPSSSVLIAWALPWFISTPDAISETVRTFDKVAKDTHCCHVIQSVPLFFEHTSYVDKK